MAHYGLYRGRVTNTVDPLMRGRIMVTTPSVAGAGTGTWAEACRDYRSTVVPPVGTTVWVMFEAGDLSRPVWMGCAG